MDLQIIQSRYIDKLADNELQTLTSAPIIVGRKQIRDLINIRVLNHHARDLAATVHLYHSKDRILGQQLCSPEREFAWRLPSSTTKDSPGRLPLFPGMKVMVQENLAFLNKVVNGSEGTVRDIVYEEIDGIRYAQVVYIHIPGSGRVFADTDDDVVPIFPETTSFS